MTIPGSSPSAYSTLANVRRREWGVIPSGSGGDCRAVRARLASVTEGLSTRERKLSALCCLPVEVANMTRSGPALGWRSRTPTSSALSAPLILIRRRPASVLDSSTYIQLPVISMSRHRSANNSPTRRPANTSTAIIAPPLDVLTTFASTGVQASRRVEQGTNLLGSLQVATTRSTFTDPTTTASCRVTRDQLSLNRTLQDCAQQGHGHVDRPRRQRMRLIELPCDVPLDLIERDLVQPMTSKERQQVRFKTPAIVQLRARRKLLLVAQPPVLGVRVERWYRLVLGSRLSRRLP